ncbi:hypothetical protein [Flammeovirga sp. EKP202]|uniref:hypothetical protein n=1 Tax=Flammeovirga sp. EKP202 TaxID=2770592 RepID=UPI00165FA7C8|nr:hypothetical protein [Flammeovirga sp. EKP202]MBD0404974.1 hypothetical protein [Flammeovirga sp. EKP202]
MNLSCSSIQMQKREFYTEQIIALLKEQEPEREDLIEDLQNSKIRKWLIQPYVYFISAEKPNQIGSDWQFDENIVLEHETEGTIILDILKGGRVGGIEFIDQIED